MTDEDVTVVEMLEICKDALVPLYEAYKNSHRPFQTVPMKHFDPVLRYKMGEMGKCDLPRPMDTQIPQILAVCPWGWLHRKSVRFFIQRFPECVPVLPDRLKQFHRVGKELDWETFKTFMERG